MDRRLCISLDNHIRSERTETLRYQSYHCQDHQMASIDPVPELHWDRRCWLVSHCKDLCYLIRPAAPPIPPLLYSSSGMVVRLPLACYYFSESATRNLSPLRGLALHFHFRKIVIPWSFVNSGSRTVSTHQTYSSCRT